MTSALEVDLSVIDLRGRRLAFPFPALTSIDFVGLQGPSAFRHRSLCFRADAIVYYLSRNIVLTAIVIRNAAKIFRGQMNHWPLYQTQKSHGKDLASAMNSSETSVVKPVNASSSGPFCQQKAIQAYIMDTIELTSKVYGFKFQEESLKASFKKAGPVEILQLIDTQGLCTDRYLHKH